MIEQYKGKIPLLIPTLCRYEHLRKCVDSLRKNKYCDYIRLIIALDYPPSEKYADGYNKIKEYVKTIDGFFSVEIIYREENYGVIRNYFELVRYASKHFEYFLFSEDDIEYSPNYLGYIFNCLPVLEKDSSVLAICGYSSNNYRALKQCNVIASHSFCAWGYAMRCKTFLNMLDNVINVDYARGILLSPKTVARLYVKDIFALNLLMDMVFTKDVYEDATLSTYSALNPKYYYIVPILSKSKNNGLDGSGAHSAVDNNIVQIYDNNEVFLPIINTNIFDNTKSKCSIRWRLHVLRRYLKCLKYITTKIKK